MSEKPAQCDVDKWIQYCKDKQTKDECQILYFEGCELTKDDLKNIGNLPHLRGLDLSFNQLTTLPDTIGNLTKLEILDLTINQIETLPESIGKLTQLQYLQLRDNQLTSLPKNIRKLTALTELNLEVNQLTELPASLGNLPNLKTIKISGNPAIKTLPKTLKNDRWRTVTGLGKTELGSARMKEIYEELKTSMKENPLKDIEFRYTSSYRMMMDYIVDLKDENIRCIAELAPDHTYWKRCFERVDSIDDYTSISQGIWTFDSARDPKLDLTLRF